MNNIAAKIYRDLLSRIQSGVVAGGSLLPPELELARQFGTNRMNAREAMKKLEAEGKEKGKK